MSDSDFHRKPEYGSVVPIVFHLRARPYALFMTFGARLAARRKELRLTQAELGKGLGTDGSDVGKQVVYGWEKNQHFPRVDQLMLICRKLQCSADHLLFGDVQNAPNPRYAAAMRAFLALGEAERLDVLAAAQLPGLDDNGVESRMPATKGIKAARQALARITERATSSSPAPARIAGSSRRSK